jgi:small subunit ribosomal protein S11
MVAESRSEFVVVVVSVTMLSLLRRSPVSFQRRFYYNKDLSNQQEKEPNSLEDVLPPPSAGDSGYSKIGPNGNNPLDANVLSQHQIREAPRYRLHCNSSRNNTITTLTQPDGNTIAWLSGGSCGFKKAQRASYEAGYQCAVRMFQRIEDIAKQDPIHIDLFFKGFGQGREALQKALLSSEGENVRNLINTVTDRTPLKIGGTRAKKARRL